jgi:hypothetical protein
VTVLPIQRPGPDYPRTTAEFAEFFPDEAACERYLERIRWPNGFVCPKCGVAAAPWRTARGRLCRACRSRASLVVGTALEGTHKPLRLWLGAAWEMSARPGFVNARTVQRILGLGSYQTAWSWQHKLRRAMAPDSEPLSGRVGLGRVEVGGSARSKRPGARQVHVGVVVELIGERRIGRIRLGRLQGTRSPELRAFAQQHVGPGSEVVSANARLAVAKVGSILHRWLLDTYQGAVSLDHLEHYLDEFAFRFNGRLAVSRGARFRSLLEQAMQTGPTTTRELFQAER